MSTVSRMARAAGAEGEGPTQGEAAQASQPQLSPAAQRALDGFDLREVPSHLLRRAHFLAEDLFASEFAEEGITPRQKAVLIVVHQEPGLKQNALAERVHMDRNTLAEMIKRMRQNQWLLRVPAPDDQRAYRLYLTQTGAEILNRVMPRDAAVEQSLLDRLPAEYQPLFLKCLKLLVASTSDPESDRVDLPKSS